MVWGGSVEGERGLSPGLGPGDVEAEVCGANGGMARVPLQAVLRPELG